MSERRATLTVPEAAEVLGISSSLAYELARRDEIPTLKLGRKVVVPRARLFEDLLGVPAEREGNGTAPLP